MVEWRRQAGKPDAVPFHTCLSTHPGGPPCQYARVGDAMICQRSGWAHICDDTCVPPPPLYPPHLSSEALLEVAQTLGFTWVVIG